MNRGRRLPMKWPNAQSWLSSQSARVLSGLGLGVAATNFAEAARDQKARDDRNGSGQDNQRNSDSNHDNRNDGGQNRDAAHRDDKNQASDQTDKHSANHDDGKSNRSDKQGSGGNDSQKNDTNDDGNGHTHHASRHQTAYVDESDSASPDNGHGDGGSSFHEELQKNKDAVDTTPTPTPAPTTPSNPNITVPAPDQNDVVLTVQSNPDVVAQVSTKGGFAFARSNGVTVISGPDGPTIIQSTPGETPGGGNQPPSEGGNNEVGMMS